MQIKQEINIRNLVGKSGIKYKVIAERANLTQQQLSDILNDRKIITAEHVGTIANALGVTVNDLYMNGNKDEVENG